MTNKLFVFILTMMMCAAPAYAVQPGILEAEQQTASALVLMQAESLVSVFRGVELAMIRDYKTRYEAWTDALGTNSNATMQPSADMTSDKDSLVMNGYLSQALANRVAITPGSGGSAVVMVTNVPSHVGDIVSRLRGEVLYAEAGKTLSLIIPRPAAMTVDPGQGVGRKNVVNRMKDGAGLQWTLNDGRITGLAELTADTLKTVTGQTAIDLQAALNVGGTTTATGIVTGSTLTVTGTLKENSGTAPLPERWGTINVKDIQGSNALNLSVSGTVGGSSVVVAQTEISAGRVDMANSGKTGSISASGGKTVLATGSGVATTGNLSAKVGATTLNIGGATTQKSDATAVGDSKFAKAAYYYEGGVKKLWARGVCYYQSCPAGSACATAASDKCPNGQCKTGRCVCPTVSCNTSDGFQCTATCASGTITSGGGNASGACRSCQCIPQSCPSGWGCDASCGGRCRQGHCVCPTEYCPYGCTQTCPNGQCMAGTCKPCPTAYCQYGCTRTCPTGQCMAGYCKPKPTPVPTPVPTPIVPVTPIVITGGCYNTSGNFNVPTGYHTLQITVGAQGLGYSPGKSYQCSSNATSAYSVSTTAGSKSYTFTVSTGQDTSDSQLRIPSVTSQVFRAVVQHRESGEKEWCQYNIQPGGSCGFTIRILP